MDAEPITPVGPPLAGPVVARQRWRDATFLHWRIAPAAVAPLLPSGVDPDVHDGASWAGLIAFTFEDSRVGPVPLGAIGDFVEINVRLYGVDARGRRGVVFRSLEAASPLAVAGARVGFGLPYRWSRTAVRREGDVIRYAARRIHGSGRTRMDVRLDPGATVDDPLARFLVDRWGLFQTRWGRTVYLPNVHEPWVLHPARVLRVRDELLALAGLPGLADRAPDSALFSPGVTARFGMRRR